MRMKIRVAPEELDREATIYLLAVGQELE